MVEHRDLDEARPRLVSRPAQIAVDLLGGSLAIGHGADDEPRTEGDIPGGKDAGRGGHEGVRIDPHRALPGGFDAIGGAQEGKVGGLPDRQDHGVARNHALGARFEGGIEAMAGIEDRQAADGLDTRDLAVAAYKSLGTQRGMDLEALALAFFNLFLERRHLLARFQADQIDFASAQAQRGAGNIRQFLHGDLQFAGRQAVGQQRGAQSFERQALLLANRGARHVDGYVPAADDHYFLADAEAVTQVHVQQEVNSFDHAIQIVAGQWKIAAAVQAHCQKERLITLGAELCQRNVLAQTRIQAEFHPQFEDFTHLGIQYIAWQPVLGNAEGQHAPGGGSGLEDGGTVSRQRQVVGRGQSRRSGPDYSDPLRASEPRLFGKDVHGVARFRAVPFG